MTLSRPQIITYLRTLERIRVSGGTFAADAALLMWELGARENDVAEMLTRIHNVPVTPFEKYLVSTTTLPK